MLSDNVGDWRYCKCSPALIIVGGRCFSPAGKVKGMTMFEEWDYHKTARALNENLGTHFPAEPGNWALLFDLDGQPVWVQLKHIHSGFTTP